MRIILNSSVPSTRRWCIYILFILFSGQSYAQDKPSQDACEEEIKRSGLDQEQLDINCMRRLISIRKQYRSTNDQVDASLALDGFFQGVCRCSNVSRESKEIVYVPIPEPVPVVIPIPFFFVSPQAADTQYVPILVPTPPPTPVYVDVPKPVPVAVPFPVYITQSDSTRDPLCKRKRGVCIATAVTAATVAGAFIIFPLPTDPGLGTPPDFPTNQ